MRNKLAILAVLALAGCAHSEPAIEVRTVEKVVQVETPCPAARPQRPAALAPLPPQLAAALAATLAKLAEYSAPGKFADQAEAYFTACPPVGE